MLYIFRCIRQLIKLSSFVNFRSGYNAFSIPEAVKLPNLWHLATPSRQVVMDLEEDVLFENWIILV